MTFKERAIDALGTAEANRHQEGRDDTHSFYRLGVAAVWALLAIATALESLQRE